MKTWGGGGGEGR